MTNSTLSTWAGWEVPTAYPSGIRQKILSGALDETGKRGSRTRMLRLIRASTRPFSRFERAGQIM